MNQPIIDSLPQLYKNFLPEIFFESAPKETLATCHDCIMCKDWEAKKARGEKYFTPQGKCCTYFPAIPNYLIGSLLSDKSAAMKEGVSRVKEIINNKIGVTPTFLMPPTFYIEKYKAFSKFNFGLANDLICPLNDRSNGNCTIWHHRNAVCSQWYCKSVGAQAGKQFWDASRDYLNKIEHMLAKYAAAQLDLILKGIPKEERLVDDRKGNLNYQNYKRLWAKWYGQELRFFQRAYEVINSLDRDGFESNFSKQLQEPFELMQQKKKLFNQAVEGHDS